MTVGQAPWPFADGQQVAGPFTILTVCTGNICRSPLSEGLLRMVLAGLPVVVHSAGASAMVGHSMTEPNRVIAAGLGVTDADVHVARQLTLEQLRGGRSRARTVSRAPSRGGRVVAAGESPHVHAA
ncbi:MAG: hypothetical protein GX862_04550 [Leucobacter sp.]|nr:hypothetical protein [Leucobacter sp.]